ncbi:hypothetical protein F4604DRAFT_817052 [Suillus subluteus]|nr:hypothetical protein F4604DRAFT_817052 [Suillus subluteus]
MFKESIEDDPMTIGHPQCSLPEIRQLKLLEIKGSRCAQLVANLTSIMEHVFLQNIQDEVSLGDFIKGFTSLPIFDSTRQAVVKIRWDKSHLLPGHDSERVMTTKTACDQLREIMDRVSLVDEEKFRFLIIGKAGCGKTTILNKVCGENVADKPSEFRGVHDIYKEMEFKDNRRMVVHDSEGFEAGHKREFQVVKRFIESRSRKKILHEQLHMIWYCLQTNSRPIQQSEKLFFASEHNVPVIAIFTKFDLFVQDQLQNIMECEEAEDIYDDEAATDSDLDSNEGSGQPFQVLEERAKLLASQKFEEHYKNVLMKMPHPPKAIVELSDLHNSTPKDSRLGSLIEATMEALTVTDKSMAKDNPRQRLGALFAKAQMAEVSPKISSSVHYGLPYEIYEKELQVPSPLFRRLLIEVWGSKWHVLTIMRIFQNCIEDHPETIGNNGSLSHPKVKKMTLRQRKVCRCVQLVADLILIMEQVFISELQTIDELELGAICKNYLSSRAHAYIFEELVNVDWRKFYNNTDPTRMITGRANAQLRRVLDSCRKHM